MSFLTRFRQNRGHATAGLAAQAAELMHGGRL
jgi:hypothetical protein